MSTISRIKKQLADNASVPAELINSFKTYPIDKVHPMAALRTAISLLGLLMKKQM